MSNRESLIATALQMRADHPIGHERYEMWKATATLMEDIAVNPAPAWVKSRAWEVAARYEAARPKPPSTCDAGANVFVCEQPYQHEGPHDWDIDEECVGGLMAVRNRSGEPVESNVTKTHQGAIQVMIFGEVISVFEEYLDKRGLYLFPIPTEDGDVPTYAIGMTEATMKERDA